MLALAHDAELAHQFLDWVTPMRIVFGAYIVDPLHGLGDRRRWIECDVHRQGSRQQPDFLSGAVVGAVSEFDAQYNVASVVKPGEGGVDQRNNCAEGR